MTLAHRTVTFRDPLKLLCRLADSFPPYIQTMQRTGSYKWSAALIIFLLAVYVSMTFGSFGIHENMGSRAQRAPVSASRAARVPADPRTMSCSHANRRRVISRMVLAGLGLASKLGKANANNAADSKIAMGAASTGGQSQVRGIGDLGRMWNVRARLEKEQSSERGLIGDPVEERAREGKGEK
eukprot:1334831-Amorphochlora_amoeboformis.AAC.1